MEKCKIYYLGKREVKEDVDGESREGNFYLIKRKKEDIKIINHHILLLDTSLSMENEIEGLKRGVKETLNALKGGRRNYVSIITYSGHDRGKRILNGVKCDKVSYEMGEVFKRVDEEILVQKGNVVSEPLETAIEITKRLAPYCNKNHIILFTDGRIEPTKWSTEEEKEKILGLAEICREKNIYFNSIGFGQHYDRVFLKKLIRKIGAGSIYHIDKIKDYYKAAMDFSRGINNRSLLKVDIENKEYFSLNTYSMESEGELKISYDADEAIICVFNEELKIKEKVINAKRYKKEGERAYEKFLYSLSLYHLINEDLEKAEYLISQTGDIEIYNKINNCYSFIELGGAMNDLKEVIEDESKRFKKGKQEIRIEKIENEKICLLEVLKKIMDDKDSKLLWDYSYKYSRIGRKKELIENRYKFIKPEVGYGKVTNIEIGKKKLNVGLRVKVEGQVIDNATNLKLDSHIFRGYNLILNGNINTDFIWCILSKELKKIFRKEKIIKEVNKYGENEIVVLDLKKMKTTNKRVLKSLNAEEIGNYLYEIEKLKCKIGIINERLKRLRLERKIGRRSSLSLKEKVRRDYKVELGGLYRQIDEFKDNKESCETYEATVLEWKIEKFPKKKEMEEAQEYYKRFRELNLEEEIGVLEEELIVMKKEKDAVEYKINIVRLSCGLMKKSLFIWDEEREKEKREMDKELGVNNIIDGKVNILTKKINGINLRQDRYRVITKHD